MSGAKADAILARSNDPTLKKRKKKPRNEDYIGGSSKTDAGGLMFRDEDDEWERRQKEDMDVDGEEAPSESLQLKASPTMRQS
jgi:pre-mRNA-splicing factor CWC26